MNKILEASANKILFSREIHLFWERLKRNCWLGKMLCCCLTLTLTLSLTQSLAQSLTRTTFALGFGSDPHFLFGQEEKH